MVDLNSAYNDAKFLSDDDLRQELSQPTGMIPGYIIMSELQDRQAIRAGAGNPNQMSMKDELLGSAPSTIASVRQYSRGGMIAKINPFDAMTKAMRNPELAAGYMQEAMNASAGGLPALSSAQAPQAPSAPPSLSSLSPQAPGTPQPLQKYSTGGIASLCGR